MCWLYSSWSPLLLYQGSSCHLYDIFVFGCSTLFLLSDGLRGMGSLLVLICKCGIAFGPNQAFVSCFTVTSSLLPLNTLSVSLYFYVLCWFLWLGSLLFILFKVSLCSHLSMARGCKMQLLWPMASPGNFIFWTFCLSNDSQWVLSPLLHNSIAITFFMYMAWTCVWVSGYSALAGSVFFLAAIIWVANSVLLVSFLALFVGYLSCLHFIFICLLVTNVFNGFYHGLLPLSCKMDVFWTVTI